MPNALTDLSGKSSGSNFFVQNWLANENCESASWKGSPFRVASPFTMDGHAEAIAAPARVSEDALINLLLEDFIQQFCFRSIL
jgi:hypothetical protein